MFQENLNVQPIPAVINHRFATVPPELITVTGGK